MLAESKKPLLPSPIEKQKEEAEQISRMQFQQLYDFTSGKEFEPNSESNWEKVAHHLNEIIVTLAMVPQGFFGGILAIQKMLPAMGLGNTTADDIVKFVLLPIFTYTSLMGKRQIVSFFSSDAFKDIAKSLQAVWEKKKSFRDLLPNKLSSIFFILYAWTAGQIFGGLAQVAMGNWNQKDGITDLLKQFGWKTTDDIAKYFTSQPAVQTLFMIPAVISNLVSAKGITSGGLQNLFDVLKMLSCAKNTAYMKMEENFQDTIETVRLLLKELGEKALKNPDPENVQAYFNALKNIFEDEFTEKLNSSQAFTGIELAHINPQKLFVFAEKHPEKRPTRSMWYKFCRTTIPLLFTTGACMGVWNFCDLGALACQMLFQSFGVPQSAFENNAWQNVGKPIVSAASFSYMCMMCLNVVLNVGRDFVDNQFGRKSANVFKHPASVRTDFWSNPLNWIDPTFWVSKGIKGLTFGKRTLDRSTNRNPLNWLSISFLMDKFASKTMNESTLQLTETAFVCLLGMFPNIYQAVIDPKGEQPILKAAAGWASFALEFSGFLFLLLNKAYKKLQKKNPFAHMVHEIDALFSMMGNQFEKYKQNFHAFKNKNKTQSSAEQSNEMPKKYRDTVEKVLSLLKCRQPSQDSLHLDGVTIPIPDLNTMTMPDRISTRQKPKKSGSTFSWKSWLPAWCKRSPVSESAQPLISQAASLNADPAQQQAAHSCTIL